MKKMCLADICCFLIVLFFYNHGTGQNINPPQEIKSPTAASLGKFGDIPVNYYTGRVNVQIPLYAHEENGIPLNIDLSYDSGGVRVNEMPSWIGQNWNMNVGGVVSRTVKGDEADEMIYSGTNLYKGYCYNYSLLNNDSWSTTNYMSGTAFSNPIIKDMEPDIFTFNFMGMTGKFFLGPDGEWKVQSSDNIKVKISLSENALTLGRDTYYPFRLSEGFTGDARKTIFKITLIDDKGNTYVFGNNQNAIEYSQGNFFDYHSGVVPNSWFLTAVTDRLGNQVYNFVYERGEYQAVFYLTYSSKYREKSTNATFWQPGGGCIYSESSPLTANGSLIAPSYLKSITTNNGYTINFNRSVSAFKSYSPFNEPELASAFTNWENGSDYMIQGWTENRFYLLYHNTNESLIPLSGYYRTDIFNNKLKNYKLDEISVSYNSALLKKIKFTRNTDTTERLNLTGVSIYEGTTPTPLVYSLFYNNFNQLPNYLSRAIDHWGYYKGGAGFTQNNNTNHYAEREPDAAYLQIGSLNRIIYPTKGFTTFEYEPHTYSKFVNSNMALENETNIAGGLRIKKIINYDGINQTVKEIRYVNDLASNTSSGILALKNKYLWGTWQMRTTFNQLYQESNFSINSIIPESNFSGSHIGYSKVYEIVPGNGKIVYEYTNYQDYPDIPYTNTLSTQQSIFNAHNKKDFKRGLEKTISFFSETDNNNPVKKIEKFYNTIGDLKTARGYNYQQFAPCPNVADAIAVGNTYEIEYSDFKQTSMTESDYFATGTVSKTTTTSYATLPPTSSVPYFGSSFKRSESLTTNVGENKSAEYYYPFDYMLTSESNNMLGNNFVPVVESFNYKSGTLISKNKTAYMLMPDNGSRAMPVATYAAKGSDPYELLMTVTKYDPNGNILQYQLANGRVNSYRYTNNLLMFKVEGAPSTESVTAANFSTFNATATKKATKYTYTPDRRLESITFPDGSFETYQYDTSLRLEKILDTNGKVLKKFEYKFQ